jgi:hypothetical protein
LIKIKNPYKIKIVPFWHLFLQEESEVINLLEQWSHIQIDDALYLLSGMFSANPHYTTRQLATENRAIRVIRDYAINIIKNSPIQEISNTP